MAQILRPDSDISLGAWLDSAGASPTELWPNLDETSPADADYVYTETADDAFEVGLSAGSEPASDAGHIVRYRVQGNGSAALTVQLIDNSVSPPVVIDTWYEQSPVPSSTATEFSHELSPSVAGTILDYTAMSLRFTAGIVDVGGGGGLSRVDHLSAEVLDTSGTLSVTTSAFTPQNSSLLVVCICKFLNDSSTTGSDVMADSIDGATGWSRAVLSSTGTEGGFTWTVQIWVKQIGSAASMTLTLSNVDESVTNAAVCFSVFSYTGYNTGTPTGGTASGDIGEDGAGTLTLSAAPDAGDVTVAARQFVPDGAVNTTATAGSGWSLIHNVTGTAGKGQVSTQQRTGSTSTTVEWTDINDDGFDAWGVNQQRGAALVIKAA